MTSTMRVLPPELSPEAAQVLRNMYANRRGTGNTVIRTERRALLEAMRALGVKP